MHSSPDPLVSVIIPCFQAQAHVEQTLESLAAQTYGPIELFLISDDGTDYAQLAARFSGRFPLHGLSTGGVGKGCVQAINSVLPLARGQVLSRLDSDDLLEPDYFERLVPLVMREGACVTPRRTEDFDSGEHWPTQGHLRRYAAFAGLSRLSLAQYISLPFNWQTLYRRDMIRMEWPNRFEQDLYFDCHVFERIGYAPFVDYFGYHYRIRQGSICHSDGICERVMESYRDAIAQLNTNGMGLMPETSSILAAELERRMGNIARFLADEAQGRLAYEPKVLVDILHYPHLAA
ncbi:MAG: glycosyltransferase [Rickettsiales bacterium]|nr:glycosyltransferase [Rickettsiales bacterium]